MSAVHITSSSQFQTTLKNNYVVIADFYADWCGPCKMIAPVYEQLAARHSKPKFVAFIKVNVDQQQDIARQYNVSAMPTFLIFRSGTVINTIRGADRGALTSAIENAVKLAGPAKPSYSSPGHVLGGPSARPRQSLSRPWLWDLNKLMTTIINFIGLYLASLFSLDPYASAENSSFNIHRQPPRPAARPVGKAAPKPGIPTPGGKKFGTLSDITS